MLMREKAGTFGSLVVAVLLFLFFAIFIANAAAGEVAEKGERFLPAFPGSVGAAKYTPGGRGGDVYVVENIEQNGPGSLRYGIETAEGPRTIHFEDGSLAIRERKRLTIAGQTAPGDGITLRFDDGGVRINNSLTCACL